MAVRNVVMGRLVDGADREALTAALDAIVALDPPGAIAVHVGTDLGLRQGNWDFAITSDFVDEEAYRTYDSEAVHNRIRAEQFAPLCAEIVCVSRLPWTEDRGGTAPASTRTA